jgi:hypothetical protein
MKRRTFLTSSLALASVVSMAQDKNPSTNNIAWKKDYSVPELELVGRTRPALFGDDFNLRNEAAEAFAAMQKAAYADGINLYSVSSYRSFARQKGIWDRKYKRYRKEGLSAQEAIRKIIEYSTVPGSSRHHWGTDLDMIDTSVPQPKDHPLIATHYHGDGVYAPMFNWLQKNAHKFDFYITYTNDPKRRGFAYEPWHWSYAPLSIPLLRQFKTLPLKKHLDEADLQGKEHLSAEFVQNYQTIWGMGINPILIA